MTTSSPLGLTNAPLVFGDPQLHTDGDIVGLAFAGDGSLWSVEEPGKLRQWNALTGRQLAGHQLSDLETLWALSGDGRLLAAAGSDLSVWDTAEGRLLAALPQESWVTALAFAGGTSITQSVLTTVWRTMTRSVMTTVATGHDDGSVRVWDSAGRDGAGYFGTRNVLTTGAHQQAVSAIAVSPDERWVASAGEDKNIVIARVKDGQRAHLLTGHTDRIPQLLWHPDGRWLISAGWDTSARVWDTQTGQPVILLNAHEGPVGALAVSADGRLLASADGSGNVHVWNCRDLKSRHVLATSAAEIKCLAFSHDGKLLACGGGDRRIQVWDVDRGVRCPVSGVRGQIIKRHLLAAVPSKTASSALGMMMPQPQTSAALSGDGARLVTNGGGTACRVWDTATRRAVLTLTDKEAIGAVAFSPDGRWIAGAAGLMVRVWNAGTGKFHATLPDHDEPVSVLAFSPDSKLLAAASFTGMGAWLWDVERAKPILLIPDALDGCTVNALAFRPSNSNSHAVLAIGGIDWMATGGSDGGISFWDIQQRCEIASFNDGTTALAWHPSGDRLASATLDRALVVWDAATQQPLREMAGHDDAITCVAFSPDGTVLASGGDDCTVRLWNTATGDETAVKELDSQVKALCFSPDGRHLFTGNANTTCSLL